jgi:Carboxypeptidase regulatory-like domain
MIPFISGLINIAAARSVVSSAERRGASAMGSISLTLLLLAPLCLSSSLPSLGQATTGSIVGTVTDPSKAVIPDADVTVKNLSTGVTSSTKSNNSGHYEFLSLPAGQYMETVLHAGFSSTSLSDLSLNLYQQLTIDVELKPGTEVQTISVEAAPTLVDTSNASLGTVIGEADILNMPLNLREVGALALLVPGTVNTTGRSLATGAANGSGFNDVGYSGSGGGSGGNLLLIDGMISRALNNSSFSLDPPPEMVQEFKIQNNVYDASFGLASGTVMNLITNSGTSEIHGSAWEYVRNSVMDASGYFALNKPALSRNQFGGTFGGPLFKKRVFYFGSYEGLRLTQGIVSSSVVPTSAEKSGDFSSFLTGTTANLCGSSGSAAPMNLNFDTGQLLDPKSESVYNCPANPQNPGAGQTSVLIGNPVSGNRLATLDPVAQKVMALYPSPNTPGVVNYTNETPQQQQNDQFDGRVDTTIRKVNTVFVRYMLGNSNILFPGALPTFNGYQHFRGQNVVGGWTRAIGPSSINDVRIGYQRDYLTYTCSGCPRAAGTLASFGIAGLTNPLPEFDEYPNIVLNNFALWGDGFPGYYPVTAPDSIEQFEDTFTKVVGRHTFAFGSNLDFWQTKGVTDPLQVNGRFNFNGQYSSLAGEIPGVNSISDLADLELGYPSGGQYTKNAIVTNLVGGRWISIFAQDSFRVHPRLTVQGGLRWEYRRQPMDTHNQIATFFPLSKTYTPGDALLLTALPDAANDALCSQAYFISASGQCLVMTSSMRAAKGLTGNKVRQVSYGPGAGYFAPRLGLSWQPLRSDRLVLHAGAGIFMDLPDTNRMGSFANNNPVSTQTPNYVTSFGTPPPLTNGVVTTTQQAFVNAPLVSLSGITSQLMPSPFYKTAETYEWSLSIQSQLAKDWASEIAYVGNRGLHLDYMHNLGNQPEPGLGDLQPRRPYPDFNTLLYDDYQAFSNYQSLYAKLEKKSSHGFAALISYTFSKSLDNEGGNIDNQSATQNDNDPNAEYALSDFNVTHTFVASPIYELPFGQGKRFLSTGRYVNLAVGGWQVSAIVTAHSGLPFTVTTSQDFSNTNSSSPRPDRTCTGSGPKTVDEWFNTGCFSTTALQQALSSGTPRFGDSGRNILPIPGLQNWDLAFIKKTKLTERTGVELKGEFFNAFNHTNFGAPGSVIGTSTVGVISSAAAPRDVQLAVKFEF